MAWSMAGASYLTGLALLSSVGIGLYGGKVHWGGLALFIGVLLLFGIDTRFLGEWFAHKAGTSLEEMMADSRGPRRVALRRLTDPKPPDPLWDRDLDI